MSKYDSYIIQKILFIKAPLLSFSFTVEYSMERRLNNKTIILDYAPQS